MYEPDLFKPSLCYQRTAKPRVIRLWVALLLYFFVFLCGVEFGIHLFPALKQLGVMKP